MTRRRTPPPSCSLTDTRADVRRKIAQLWRNEIIHQPMGLVADDGTKSLALAELTVRTLEEAGYQRDTHSSTDPQRGAPTK